MTNKAVIDRRLRPQCCHLGSYFKRPKSSPVRPLACNWHYCAQLIAKPEAVCASCFSWAATSSNPGLWANMTSSIKPEVHNISLRRQRRTEPRPWVTCSRTDKHTYRQTRSSQYSAPLSEPSNQRLWLHGVTWSTSWGQFSSARAVWTSLNTPAMHVFSWVTS